MINDMYLSDIYDINAIYDTKKSDMYWCHKYQEVGHWLTAAPRGVKMGIPYLIPNITLGSFGAVTQVFIFSQFQNVYASI